MFCFLSIISHRFWNSCFNTLVKAHVGPTVVGLGPNWGMRGKKERMNIVLHQIQECFDIPARCVTVKEEEDWFLPLSLMCWKMPNKMIGKIQHRVLHHWSRLSGANSETIWILQVLFFGSYWWRFCQTFTIHGIQIKLVAIMCFINRAFVWMDDEWRWSTVQSMDWNFVQTCKSIRKKGVKLVDFFQKVWARLVGVKPTKTVVLAAGNYLMHKLPAGNGYQNGSISNVPPPQ